MLAWYTWSTRIKVIVDPMKSRYQQCAARWIFPLGLCAGVLTMHVCLCLCLCAKYPLRTNSAPPNLDEQKREQVGAESGSFR